MSLDDHEGDMNHRSSVVIRYIDDQTSPDLGIQWELASGGWTFTMKALWLHCPWGLNMSLLLLFRMMIIIIIIIISIIVIILIIIIIIIIIIIHDYHSCLSFMIIIIINDYHYHS